MFYIYSITSIQKFNLKNLNSNIGQIYENNEKDLIKIDATAYMCKKLDTKILMDYNWKKEILSKINEVDRSEIYEGLIFIYYQNQTFKKMKVENGQVILLDTFYINQSWSYDDSIKLKHFCADCFFQDDIFTHLINELSTLFLNEKGFSDTFEPYHYMMLSLLKIFKCDMHDLNLNSQFFKIVHNDKNTINLLIQEISEKESECLSHLLFFSNKAFYYLCEKLIKINVKANDIIKEHPYYSHNWEIITPKMNQTFQKYVNTNIFKDINIGTLNKMYNHKLIGPNGLNFIFDFSCLLSQISSCKFSFDIIERLYLIIDKMEISPKNLINFIAKKIFYEQNCMEEFFLSDIRIIVLISDTIEMAEQLNYKVDKTMLGYIHRLHDEYSLQIRQLKNEESKKEFLENCEKYKSLLDYLPNSKDYTVIAPTNLSDLDSEGRNMHNCVASYYEKIARGDSKVFFMRKKRNIDKSFITVEFNRNNDAVQFYRKQNTTVSTNERNFINRWEENIKHGKKEINYA